MLAQVQSATVVGVEALGVIAEIDVGLGLPGWHLVGLGATAVREGSVRVRAALTHSGFRLPARKITVNLAPADLRKDGAAFDLAIAAGVLAANGEVPHAALEDVVLLGELGLDGAVRPVAGALPAALWAKRAGKRAVILPAGSAGEASAIGGLTIYEASSLPAVVAHLRGETQLAEAARGGAPLPSLATRDLLDVRGQGVARFALEVAAAGGHNLLMVGPPGAGKSMLAERLPSILPPLSDDEALEASVVWSAAGMLGGRPLLRERPFRAPHHDVSVAGLIGGGPGPRPGEISLAHNGVLFLDELLEFRRPALEALRQPLEARSVTIVRARQSLRFPAAFALVAAMNPCPCGYRGSAARACICDLGTERRYRARLSGPLLDRFDLHIWVEPVTLGELDGDVGESSAAVRARVLAARQVQAERLAGTPLHCNAQLGVREIARYCRLGPAERELLGTVADRRGLSARAVHRLLRVARTLADLAGHDSILRGDLQAAVDFRLMDEGRA